jgi:hypothetical protein
MSSNPPNDRPLYRSSDENETKAALDASEDAWNFNYKSLVEQHEKFLASVNMQNQLQLAQLNNISMQALQNAVNVANQLAQSNADSQNLANKQAIAHRDIAIASEWDVPATDAIAQATAAGAGAVAEKAFSTISPTIPGPSTSPGVAGSGVNAQSPTTGG